MLVLFTLFLFVGQIKAATYETPVLCFKLNKYLNNKNDQYYSIDCKSENLKLFIAEARYENDFDSYCYNKLINKDNLTQINADHLDKRCYANKKAKISTECNGKTKCDLSLNHDNNEYDLIFDEKFIGYKSCNFVAKRLIVSYECIDVDYKKNPRVIDICSTQIKEIRGVQDGFIKSPGYPMSYSGRLYCTIKIAKKELTQRIELYLIKLRTEKESLLTGNPTDYLDVNARSKYFGDKHDFQIIYNDTQDVDLLFKADNFFNKGGFLLYFKIVSLKPNERTIHISSVTRRKIVVGEATTLLTTSATTTTAESINETTTNYYEVLNTTTTPIAQLNETSELNQTSQPLANNQKIIQSSYFSGDKIKIACLILVVFVIVLFLVLIFMFVSLKKRKNDCRNNLIYSTHTTSSSIKDQNQCERPQSTTNFDASTLFVSFNNDSKAYLLANTSIQQQSVEIYEDVTLLDNHEEKKLRLINENPYSDDPTCCPNDYYYIKTTNDDELNQQLYPIEVLDNNDVKTPTLNKKMPQNNNLISTSTPNNMNTDHASESDYYKVPLNNTPIKEVL